MPEPAPDTQPLLDALAALFDRAAFGKGALAGDADRRLLCRVQVLVQTELCRLYGESELYMGQAPRKESEE